MRPDKSIRNQYVADILAVDTDGLEKMSNQQRETLVRLAATFREGELVYSRIVIVKTPSESEKYLLCRCVYPGGGEIYIGIEEDGYAHS